MPRRPRRDAPGVIHHVINRGQDRGQLFYTLKHYRFFTVLTATSVRAGRILVHAYCLMPNHFHLVVESVDGDISETMRLIQFRYAAYFNATRDHTDHVFGGRFHSCNVSSRGYLRHLIGYVYRNPIGVDGCVDPFLYPYGSARLQVLERRRAFWVSRHLVDSFLDPETVRRRGRKAAYRQAFRLDAPSAAVDRLIEARLEHPARGTDDLDGLRAASPSDTLLWLQRRARDAEGGAPGMPMADAESILAVVERHRHEAPLARQAARQGQSCALWDLVAAGLLRDLGGLNRSEASRQLGISLSAFRRRYRAHREALDGDRGYGAICAALARQAIDACFGSD